MLQMPIFGDERQLEFCAFCGSGETGTRDHCPSRVLLDEPYPANVPVVPSCPGCNARFSLDEQYFACLISCAAEGTTDPANITRPKIQRILSDTPALRARIDQSCTESASGVVFHPEAQRISDVVTKLAQGHALHELHESCLRAPTAIQITPLWVMSNTDRYAFESCRSDCASIWPEVGSRAIQRMVGLHIPPEYPWLVVQQGLYRYHASVGPSISIRIVIQEYLACHVRWD